MYQNQPINIIWIYISIKISKERNKTSWNEKSSKLTTRSQGLRFNHTSSIPQTNFSSNFLIVLPFVVLFSMCLPSALSLPTSLFNSEWRRQGITRGSLEDQAPSTIVGRSSPWSRYHRDETGIYEDYRDRASKEREGQGSPKVSVERDCWGEREWTGKWPN